MKRNNIVFGIIFFLAVAIMTFSLIITVLGFAVDETEGLTVLLAVSGSIGFLIIFFGAFLMSAESGTNEQKQRFYEDLVDKAEADPKTFVRKLKRLTRLGNTYIIFLLILVGLTLSGVVMLVISSGRLNRGSLTLILALAGVIYVILRSLYIKPEPIDGVTINRREYPEIFKIIDSAVQKTNAPTPDRIFIIPEANAAVTRLPVGFGFRTENVMMLGLHLLEMLDERELESVLIHELAHIYNQDTLLSGKVAKNITRWTKITEQSGSRGIVAYNLLIKFAIFYIIKMRMYQDAVSKQLEYVADTEAAKYAGKEAYFSAFVKMDVMNAYLNKPREDGESDIRALETPPDDFYTKYFEEVHKNFDDSKHRFKNRIVGQESTKYDSHPSFCERMAHIGVTDLDFESVRESGAKSYDGETSRLIPLFNEEWRKNALNQWSDFHGSYLQSLKTIESYTGGTGDKDADYKYAFALEDVGRLNDAFEFYTGMLEAYPSDTIASFRKGLLLLNRHDAAGIDLCKNAIALDSRFAETGVREIHNYLLDNGTQEQRADFKTWSKNVLEHAAIRNAEQEKISVEDKFIPAVIEPEKLQKIQQQLVYIGSVNKAYLVSKQLRSSLDTLLILAIQTSEDQIKNAKELIEMMESLNVPHFILHLNANMRFVKPISKVQSSLIFNRKD